MISPRLSPAPKIIFQDQYFLVIEKPAGLVVNRAQSVKAPTLQDWVEKKFKIGQAKTDSDFARRSGLVHRLDKETSGLILVAKKIQSFKNLQSQFKKRAVTKGYLVLVHGQIKDKKGKISLPIARNPLNRQKFGCYLDGKKAETLYKLKKIYKKLDKKKTEFFSLLEAFPKTGRTHQIRVHFKAINHPLVSDPAYAGRKTLRKDKIWCPRLFLHAFLISFNHPQTKQKLSFSLKLAADLKRALEKLSL